MDLQEDEVPLATEHLDVLRVASRKDASQVSTNLLDLPTDLLADILHRAMPWRCRLVCRAFRTHMDGGRTSVHLTSLTTNASLGSELRALLARLPGLEQLVAAGDINDIRLNFLSACPQLVSLRLEHSAWLEDLSGLESLCVQDCRNLRSVPTLAACPKLASLSLSDLRVNGLDVLAECTQLQSLSVHGYRRSSVPFLAACTQLTSVTWDIGSITSLTPLSLCPRLLSLLCRDTDSVDLAPLAACRELTSLALPCSRNLTGFATLSAFSNLQRLRLAYSDIPGFATSLRSAQRLRGWM